REGDVLVHRPGHRLGDDVRAEPRRGEGLPGRRARRDDRHVVPGHDVPPRRVREDLVGERFPHHPDRRGRHRRPATRGRRRPRGSALTMTSTVRPATRSRKGAPVHSASMSMDRATVPTTAAPEAGVVGTGAWVVLPTYEEAENLPGIAAAIL